MTATQASQKRLEGKVAKVTQGELSGEESAGEWGGRG